MEAPYRYLGPEIGSQFGPQLVGLLLEGQPQDVPRIDTAILFLARTAAVPPGLGGLLFHVGDFYQRKFLWYPGLWYGMWLKYRDA